MCSPGILSGVRVYLVQTGYKTRENWWSGTRQECKSLPYFLDMDHLINGQADNEDTP